MKKNLLILILIFMGASILSGCGDKVKPGVQAVKREQVTGIGLQTVALAPVDEYYETSGTVRAKTVSLVASRMMGNITSVRVNEGDRVSTGQLLLTVDDSDTAMKVKGAAEGYNEALKALEAARENKALREMTWQRYKQLYDEKALSRQELDQIETQKKVASLDCDRAQAAVNRVEAGVSEAKIYQGYTRVKAPVSGMVTGKKAEIGSMAVPGMPLLTIEDTSAYRIEVNADEKLSGKIHPGIEVKIVIESLAGEIKGVVTDVVQSIDPASRSFLVKISLKKALKNESPTDKEIHSGLYARVNIPVGRKDVLSVPKGAVVERGQLTGVYTVNAANIITYRLVRTGKSRGDTVEILSGLNPGDKVIVSGVDKAVDGGIAVAQQ
ncbi:MAG: efflux RND transporter periplasmic adaptor subunit [Thermodesulfovibrionales bacterium]